MLCSLNGDTYCLNKTKQKAARRRVRKTKSPAGSKGVQALMHPKALIHKGVPEYKHFDILSGGYIAGVAYTGTVSSVFAPTQGTAGNQRVGDNCQIVGIEFRANQFQQGTSTALRYILFAWNVDSALSVPANIDILQAPTTDARSLVSPYNSDSVEQGKLNVLFDRVVTSVAGGPASAHFEVAEKVSLPVVFDAGLTSGTGKLYLYILSDAALTANSPSYQWWLRAYFVDE